jgi:hypothetical protein
MWEVRIMEKGQGFPSWVFAEEWPHIRAAVGSGRAMMSEKRQLAGV